MAKRPNAFTQATIPLPPMTPCYGCGQDGDHDNKLFVLVEGGKWYCRRCFRKGPGHSWPGPTSRGVDPGVNKPALRRPALRRPSR